MFDKFRKGQKWEFVTVLYPQRCPANLHGLDPQIRDISRQLSVKVNVGKVQTCIVQGAVCPDRTTFRQKSFLAYNSCDTASTEPCRSFSDQFCQSSEELAFCQSCLDREEMSENTNYH
jgi:hypothetical protein